MPWLCNEQEAANLKKTLGGELRELATPGPELRAARFVANVPKTNATTGFQDYRRQALRDGTRNNGHEEGSTEEHDLLSNATLFLLYDLSQRECVGRMIKCARAIQHSSSAWASFVSKLTAMFTVTETKTLSYLTLHSFAVCSPIPRNMATPSYNTSLACKSLQVPASHFEML